MKTSPAMLGIGKWFWVLFLIPHRGIWSIDGEESCDMRPHVKRNSNQNVLAGEPFKLECPMAYCAKRPNVTWCKFNEQACLILGPRPQGHMKWEDRKNISVFSLFFDQALASDNGSYRCTVRFSSEIFESHSITIYVTEQTQSYSDLPLINTTNPSESSFENEMGNKQLILYSLLPLGVLPVLITCVYLLCCLKTHQGEQKKPSGAAERGINLVDVPQPFKREQTEVATRQNSQTRPSETRASDNDPGYRGHEESCVYSKPGVEESKQGVVYASLNHSIIEKNPRQARHVNEAPTEYAAICVRT